MTQERKEQEGTSDRNRTSAAGLGYLYVVISAALFGLMPLFTKTAYRYGSDPYTVSFMRFFYTMLVSGCMLKLMPSGTFAIFILTLIPESFAR